MRRECRERFPRHQRKPLVSDPGMYPGTCVTHVLWCMPGSLTRSGGENVPDIPGACATRNVAYLARDPWMNWDPSNDRQSDLLYNTPLLDTHFICEHNSVLEECNKVCDYTFVYSLLTYAICQSSTALDSYRVTAMDIFRLNHFANRYYE